jgi:hypothetical protein
MQFLQAVDKDGNRFKYICWKLYTVTHGNLKVGFFYWPSGL